MSPEFLFKPVQPFPKGSRELNFYNFLQGSSLTPEVLELKKFLPQFYGTHNIPQKPQKTTGPTICEICCLFLCLLVYLVC